uniref:Uncharacterized protein n=1 Tax=viral metagenome TaxID=1070528 RepID=A0A6C0EY08_9ZZZZ
MEEIKVQVQGTPYVRTNTINNIKISINRIVLFKSVSVSVNLLEDNKLIENKFFDIKGDDYIAWGNDDNYIVNYVLGKLNMSRSNVNISIQ